MWEFKPDERGEVKVGRIRRKLGVKKGLFHRYKHSGGWLHENTWRPEGNLKELVLAYSVDPGNPA